MIADAQIELGRYGAAARTLQRMVDLKPELASYARVSYFRELHGDLAGALQAMRLAVSAGGTRRGQLRPDACSARCSSTAATTPRPSAPTARCSRATRATRRRAPAWRGSRPAAADSSRRSAATGGAVERDPPARVRGRPGRDRAGGRPARRGPARLCAGRRRGASCCAPTGSTPTSTWRCSRPTMAARARRRLRPARLAAAPSVRSADALAWALSGPGGTRPRCASPIRR